MLRTENPPVIKLSDYTPPAFQVSEIALTFDLDPKVTTVRSKMSVERTAASPDGASLVLNGEKIDLLTVELDGKPLTDTQFEKTDTGLTIPNVPDHFELSLKTTCSPQANTSLEGLYVSAGRFCTQCEPEGFRRITYFPDRPDVMSVYSVTINADKEKYPVLLSNGNEVKTDDLGNGRHSATYADPFPKPSYLFALVAGDLGCLHDTFTTKSGREVSLNIYVEPGKEAGAAYAMDCLKRSMAWDEQTFGLEYDLDVFNIVAVSDFNFGAMENKSLNIFNDRFILADPDTATDKDFENIEAIVAHEYFHNWSGNRVTCRDWFQLSLKEGLTVFRDQEFTSDMRSRGVKRVEDASIMRLVQFREDAGPLAHPVRPESYMEINNFYTATVYDKGAEVIRMMHTILGRDAFMKGIALYFDRHDGQAVTCDDFVQAMADASGHDLTEFKTWYSQAGTPHVTAKRDWDPNTGTLTVHFNQDTPPTPGQDKKKPAYIPLSLGFVDANGKPMTFRTADSGDTTDQTVIAFAAPELTFIAQFDKPSQSCPIPSLNRQFSAPINIQSDTTEKELAALMAGDPDPFARWDASQALAVQLLLADIEARQKHSNGPDTSAFIEAFGAILTDQKISPAYKAKLMLLPVESYLADQMDVIDVENIYLARNTLRRSLANAYQPQLEDIYEANDVPGEYSPDAESAGKRALRNTSLAYLAALENEQSETLLWQHFDGANNMTERFQGLMLLTDSETQNRDRALDAFYDRYQDNPLVLDKWLSAQAMSHRPDTLATVKRLMKHDAFTMKNPNRVRSLIGAFSGANQLRFHEASGEGYAFLADQVITLNEINPQTAARMMSPLCQWRRFDSDRQTLMKAALERILGTANLSSDIMEVASKALKD